MFKVLDGGSGSGLELNHISAPIQMFRVDDHLDVQLVVRNHPLDRLQIGPQVVGVENSERGPI